jgi:hypothetical protein
VELLRVREAAPALADSDSRASLVRALCSLPAVADGLDPPV